MLYKGEVVWDNPDKEQSLVGDGTSIIIGGDRRLLSATPRPAGHDTRKYSKAFGAVIPLIPRSEWSARLKEQTARKARVSDIQKFDPDDQDGLPTCWAAGTCHTGSTCRVQAGLPFVRLSACSIAVPISGGHSGGYEGDAVEYMVKYGAASVAEWGYCDTNRSLNTNPAVIAARTKLMALEVYECNSFDEFMTAHLLGFGCTVSYNWWSHVVMSCDGVEVESNSYGLRHRNNWGNSYGAKNDAGFPGYGVFREGKGTPSGGFAFRQMLAAI